ncbi:hypothetical protein [Paenibacillus agricola]|uniref:hypothetical protein n=1 Tax=Paenibacillus agricola TaxID=2716264 RepID=UPI001A9DF492|nr:hypothetical protein [Paenibacillus agricola]
MVVYRINSRHLESEKQLLSYLIRKRDDPMGFWDKVAKVGGAIVETAQRQAEQRQRGDAESRI